MDGRLLLKPVEAANALGVSRAKVYELISMGVIPSVRIGGVLRVPAIQLQAWVASQVHGGGVRREPGGAA